ncbi:MULTISPECIES: hypothetical protein [Schaalia]|uniref:hypothetical protein n=1 Tax=Schaalia TaxID=2529408 RepID=UPI0026E983B0|nr:hypothetical protein [Schaalia hyovaginalis]MDD7554544.1 hypothetical protein [Schaalia hyovaginalis]MDY3093379.1 hypothetical protein [Schaalia hyovaginalis]
MSLLASAALDLTKALDDLGIRAVTDPRDLDLPGVYLAPNEITTTTLDGAGLAVSWDVYLVAPDNGAHIAALGDLLDRIHPLTIGKKIRPQGLTLPNISPDPLPALHFEIETETTP